MPVPVQGLGQMAYQTIFYLMSSLFNSLQLVLGTAVNPVWILWCKIVRSPVKVLCEYAINFPKKLTWHRKCDLNSVTKMGSNSVVVICIFRRWVRFKKRWCRHIKRNGYYHSKQGKWGWYKALQWSVSPLYIDLILYIFRLMKTVIIIDLADK